MNRILQKVVVEVCTGPSLTQGPYPTRPGSARDFSVGHQMKGDFSNGLGRARYWEVIFLTDRAGKWKVIFPTGWQKRNEFGPSRACADLYNTSPHIPPP